MAIHFFEEDITYPLKKKSILKSWIKLCIEEEGFTTGELNYILCSDDYLLEMNKQYLDHDTYTDIITFDTSSGEQRAKSKEQRLPTLNSQLPTKISGDIFISIDRVKENAKKFEVTEFDELRRVLIHGALHLMGYKDKSKKDVELMRNKENYYLKKAISQ
jgi:probable rRNA maturation factor